MSKKEPGLLPKLEIMILGIFFLGFLIWAVSKCSATQRRYQEQAEFLEQEQAMVDSVQELMPEGSPIDTSVQPINPPQKVSGQKEVRVPVLYVTINGLNMRSGPGLNYRILDRLELYEEVEFLGEVTDSTQEINLGEITTDEPWVKVKTRKGQNGWVYGAGVDYYKYELQGVDTE